MKTKDTDLDPRRGLASTSALLEHPDAQALIARHSRPFVLAAIHNVLARRRTALGSGKDAPPSMDLIEDLRIELSDLTLDRLRPVINATGIILHTGLGRAVLPPAAVEALGSLGGCCNLQIDIESGQRGKRNAMTESLLTRLTGAEDAMVVNNNAAATLLILAALCHGMEVIVSRGQLIEIGGSYRLPDCIHHSGAILVEVGTTNRTHLRDYETALTEQTGAVMRVNPSNYRFVGFWQQVPIADLVTLKQTRPVFVVDDLGCGALVDLRQFGLPHEPTVPDSIAAGADLVCFSGDKLIGGPQAGIIVGKRNLIQKIRQHPLTRMLRVGKLTDMALEQTLRLFLEADSLPETHPVLRMLTADVATLRRRAMRLRRQLQKAQVPLDVRVAPETSEMGGGSLPGVDLETWVLAVKSPEVSAECLSSLLRRHEPPVIARVKHDEVLLDMRTLLPGEDRIVAQVLERIAGPE